MGARGHDDLVALLFRQAIFAQDTAPILLALVVPLAAALELLRGWRPSGAASALLGAMSVLAAVLGAWFFLLQLRNVRALLGRDGPRGG